MLISIQKKVTKKRQEHGIWLEDSWKTWEFWRTVCGKRGIWKYWVVSRGKLSKASWKTGRLLEISLRSADGEEFGYSVGVLRVLGNRRPFVIWGWGKGSFNGLSGRFTEGLERGVFRNAEAEENIVEVEEVHVETKEIINKDEVTVWRIGIKRGEKERGEERSWEDGVRERKLTEKSRRRNSIGSE